MTASRNPALVLAVLGCIGLLAYQASLVDAYPPFSFDDSPPVLPAARVAPGRPS